MSTARRFGVRGWQRLEGVYPPRTKPAEMLGHYATLASVVEVESTFSGIPKPERLAAWADQTPPEFRFDVLAFGGLTLHQRRPGHSGAVAGMSWTETAVEPPDAIFDDFRSSVAPLLSAGRLGTVIAQFPPWFECGEAGFTYLERFRERLPDIPIAVEFRHPTWQTPSQQDQTLESLIELEIGLVVPDFPPDDPDWTPPLATATVEDLAVVRLHGRDAARWPRTHAAPVEPLEYSYSDADLHEWVERVRSLQRDVDEVHVLFGTAPRAEALEAANRLSSAVTETEEAEARWGYVP